MWLSFRQICLLGSCLVVALVMALFNEAKACAACACGDPTLTLMGDGRSFDGRFRFSSEYQHRSERAPSTVGTSQTTENRLNLGLAFTPKAWFQTAFRLPIVYRRATHAHLGRDETLGMGDSELRLRFILFGGTGRRVIHHGGLTTSLRMPTGQIHQRDGTPLAGELQPGTGGWIPEVGAWYAFFQYPWSLFMSSSLARPTTGHEGFRSGQALLPTLHAQYQLSPTLAMRVGLDGRLLGPSSKDESKLERTGGVTILTSGSVLYAPREDMTVHLTGRAPVMDNRASRARTGLTVLLGTTIDL